MRNFTNLALLGGGHSLVHWYTQGFFWIVPKIGEDYGLTNVQMGRLHFLRLALGAVSNIFAGAAVDWLGKLRLVLAASILWSALVYLLVGLSPSFLILQLVVAVMGLGATAWHPAAMSTLSTTFAERKGFALSTHEFGANVGDAAAPIAFGALLAVLSWRYVLGINVVPGILLAVALWIFMRRVDRRGEGQVDFGSYMNGIKAMLSNSRLLMLAGISSLRTGSQNVIMAFVPIYLDRAIGMSASEAGSYGTLLYLPSLASAMIVGTISDRTGRRPTMIFSLSLSAFLMFGLGWSGMGLERTDLIWPLTGIGWAFAGSLVVLGLFLFSIRPVIFAFALETTQKEVGSSTIALIFGVNIAAAALAPLLAGWVADSFGLVNIFYLSAALMMGSLILTLALPLAYRRKS
jgi:MFS family permease